MRDHFSTLNSLTRRGGWLKGVSFSALAHAALIGVVIGWPRGVPYREAEAGRAGVETIAVAIVAPVEEGLTEPLQEESAPADTAPVPLITPDGYDFVSPSAPAVATDLPRLPPLSIANHDAGLEPVMPEARLEMLTGVSVSADASGDASVKPLSDIRPPYPLKARRAGWEGAVTVHALIDKTGRAVEVRIISSSGYAVLDEAVVTTLERARYQPPNAGGLPSEGELTLRYIFKLKD